MIRAIEVIVDNEGNVRPLETVPAGENRRAVLLIFDDPATASEVSLLSENALADWNRPEEDEAWAHLQVGH